MYGDGRVASRLVEERRYHNPRLPGTDDVEQAHAGGTQMVPVGIADDHLAAILAVYAPVDAAPKIEPIQDASLSGMITGKALDE